MALIPCPECGNPVSTSASSCPKCGHPVQKPGLDAPAPWAAGGGVPVAPAPTRVPFGAVGTPAGLPPNSPAGLPPNPAGTRPLPLAPPTLAPPVERYDAPRRIVRRLLILFGIVLAIPVLLFLAAMGYEFFERQANRAKGFSELVKAEFPEAEIAAAAGGPKTLTTFRPGKAGSPVRIVLFFMEPYEFEVAEAGSRLFSPPGDLAVVRAGGGSDGVVRRTTTVDLTTIPFPGFVPPSGTPEAERYRRLRIAGHCEMHLEFVPTDTSDYRIEFRGPTQGFRKYVLRVEQQGL